MITTKWLECVDFLVTMKKAIFNKKKFFHGHLNLRPSQNLLKYAKDDEKQRLVWGVDQKKKPT